MNSSTSEMIHLLSVSGSESRRTPSGQRYVRSGIWSGETPSKNRVRADVGVMPHCEVREVCRVSRESNFDPKLASPDGERNPRFSIRDFIGSQSNSNILNKYIL